MSTSTAERVPFPQVDPRRNQIILAVGRKGGGKSHHARRLFRAWPGVHRVVIDPTGDADPGDDLEPMVLTGGAPPGEIPLRKDKRPAVVRYIADPMRPTYHDDLDAALAMSLFPKDQRTLTWVDEGGEVFPANRTGPHGRRVLHQSRHWNASLIICCPRPQTIDPLCLSQADRVVMFDVPNPRDRDRIAESIGWHPKHLHAALDSVVRRGEHWFLVYDAKDHIMYECPPLPEVDQ